MATKLFLLGAPLGIIDKADTHRATNTANLRGTNIGWEPHALRPDAALTGLQSDVASTDAGPTAGIEIADFEWLSLPVAADITISGAITANLWMSESSMFANVAANFVVDKVAAIDGAITNIVTSARVTEVAVTTRAVNNFTATPGAGVTLNRGDRLRVRVFGDDAGTMATGFTFDLSWAGTTVAADGDTYITFTETISFETANPAGSTLYLTSTAAAVNPGSSNELEMWTARGGGSADLVTNTVAGWTAGLQVTDSGGGTAQEWYSKQLQAFTLGGKAKLNVRVRESNTSAWASYRAEIAICASDGTGAVIWGIGALDTSEVSNGHMTTTDTARSIYVAGDDTSVTDGQRLRVRLYVDDSSNLAMVASFTATLGYNGTTAAAAGDTYLTLPQSVTEFTARPYIQTISRPGLYLRGPHMGPPVLIRQLSGEAVVVVVGTTVFIIDTSPAA